MRVSGREAADSVSIKINPTKRKEKHGGGDSHCQNRFAPIGPQQQDSKSITRSHHPHPWNQDVSYGKGKLIGNGDGGGRMQQGPNPTELSKRSWTNVIEQIVRGNGP